MTFIADSISVEGSFTASSVTASNIYATTFFGDGSNIINITLSSLTGFDGNKGDITISGTGSTYSINTGVVTNTKLANMATKTYKGRTSVGTGVPEDLTVSQLKTDLSLELVDNTSDTTKNSATASLTNKTINLTDNTVTDTSTALGDLTKSNGTKFVRFGRGTALQQLRVNAGGTDLEWATISSSGGATYSIDVMLSGSTYSFTTNDFLSIRKTVSSDTYVYLPSIPLAGKTYVIKDSLGVSFNYPITIDGNGNTIDGNNLYIIKIKNNPSISITYDGYGYIVI